MAEIAADFGADQIVSHSPQIGGFVVDGVDFRIRKRPAVNGFDALEFDAMLGELARGVLHPTRIPGQIYDI